MVSTSPPPVTPHLCAIDCCENRRILPSPPHSQPSNAVRAGGKACEKCGSRDSGELSLGKDLRINSSRFSSAMGVSVVNGRCAFAMQESREETIGGRRSRSRWLRVIRSVSVAFLATYENGYFHIAQSGHSYFAATTLRLYLTQSRKGSIAPSQHRNVPTLRNGKYFHPALRAVCSLLSDRVPPQCSLAEMEIA
jgi:hypothetical protein